MSKHTLVLTGFMGTGKTSVGQTVARQLGREFVDMDAVIAAREGCTVAEIFATRGEAYFRARERALCAELAGREDLVIATGGGTLVNSHNRAQFENATVICLDASTDELLRRLNGARDRPLLQADGRQRTTDDRDGQRERIEALLDTRREAYAAMERHIDTTGRTVDDVAREVMQRFNVGEAQHIVSLRVRTPDGAYPIHLGRGLLDRVGELLARTEFAARCAVVINSTVGQRYAGRVVESLRAGGFDPVVIEIPDGEAYKTLDMLRGVYDEFVRARLERRSLVLALGGGVIGDLAGFASATFLRGVPFVQIPTTLLAMVDASIGGKVAVNLPAGKNLIGAFKFPHAVIADAEVLETLPVEEFRSGLAEVIKHGIIGDAQLFNELGRVEQLDMDWIARAMRVKIDYVERDPYEEHIRAHLNLGHTFGHALETSSNYQLRHGYAVALGLAVAARLAVRIGWCEVATRDRIIEVLERKELPAQIPRQFSTARILEALGADKKIREGKLRLILPRAIGTVEIAENVPREEITAALEARDL
jgi:shikimate kinase / 3-dehydroquinate synthase